MKKNLPLVYLLPTIMKTFFNVKNKNNRIEKEIPCNYKPIIKLARN